MDDHPEDTAAETPMQRALRLKTAAIAARREPPVGDKRRREQAARMAAGASKPWLKR
jgi:hypothetical protein